MRKIVMFFVGILLLLATFAALYLSGMLFDLNSNRRIEPFIFQPNNLSTERIGRPIPIEDMKEKSMRERLVKKFVNEYFYITPDVENIARRTRSDSILAAMSAPDVFRDWQRTEAKNIETLAEKKVFRQVLVSEIIRPPTGDFWEVYYELVTWDKPNDMDLVPKVQRGVLQLRISFEKGIREQRGGRRFDVQKYLESGGDPAAIFKFRVDEVRR